MGHLDLSVIDRAEHGLVDDLDQRGNARGPSNHADGPIRVRLVPHELVRALEFHNFIFLQVRQVSVQIA